MVKAWIKKNIDVNKYFCLIYIWIKLTISFVYLHQDEFYLSTNNCEDCVAALGQEVLCCTV